MSMLCQWSKYVSNGSYVCDTGESAQFELSEHIGKGQNTEKKSITLVTRSKQAKDGIDNINTS